MAFPLATTDRLMLRFSRTGDPRVLGRLFDRTAPELLRIATWLCGNRTDAEDLLQRTFVTVIEARGNYDPARRALPWLCGIVGNHARKLHEQRQRRVELGNGPTAERDPAAVAADAELAATVLRLRAEMGSPYAEVLDLHLGQGLNSKQIAERLDRPAGTVRTQLVRALALLRQRLPSGFVAGMLIAPAAKAASLATVRAMVVGKAGVGSAAVAGAMAATATSSIGGMLVGKKLAVVVPVLLLLLGGGAWALWQTRQADAAVPEAGPEVATFAANTPTLPAGDARADAPASREPAIAASTGDPGFGTLVVRMTWQHDGSPAANVGLRVMPQPGTLAHVRESLTDAEGRTEVRGIRPGRCWASSSFTNLHVFTIDAGTVQTVDLVAKRDGIVRGTVVDVDGQPVPDARVWRSEVNPYQGFEVARSDAHGRFELAADTGQYIGARKVGHAPSSLREVNPAENKPVTLTLPGAGGSVRGRVFGSEGQPLARAVVHVGATGGHGLAGSTMQERSIYPTPTTRCTDDRGEFLVEGIATGSTDVRVWATGHGPFEGKVLVEAGRTSETIVTMQRGAVVEGTATDASRTRSPGVRVTAVAANADHFAQYFARTPTTTDALGRFRLEDLPAGPNRLRARLDEQTASAELDLSAGAVTTWNPVLAADRSMTGTIVDPDGKPLAGFQVGMLQKDQISPNRWAASDGEGRFTLGNVGKDPFGVLVQQGDTLVAQRSGIAPDTRNLEITLTAEELPTATIQGRVVDRAGRPVAASTSVINRAFRFGHGGSNDPTDGTFRHGPLPAGVFDVSVEARGFGRMPLGTVKLRPGETHTFAETVLAPAGRAEIRVFADSDFRGGMVGIWRDDGTSMTHLMMEGKKASGDLPPGSYLAVVQTGHRETGSVSFVVRSGEVTACELRCSACAMLTIDFRDAGRNDPELTVTTLVRNAARELVQVVRTHPQNTRPLSTTARLAPGTYDLDSTASDGRHATAQVTIRSATEQPALTIDLPAK